MRILLAEDDAINKMYMCMLLESKGWEVTAAKNGSEALLHFESKTFDVVLLDVNMPIIDGITAAQKMREIEKQRESIPIPFIAITGYDTVNSIHGTNLHLFIKLIPKPINETILLQTLNAIESK